MTSDELARAAMPDVSARSTAGVRRSRSCRLRADDASMVSASSIVTLAATSVIARSVRVAVTTTRSSNCSAGSRRSRSTGRPAVTVTGAVSAAKASRVTVSRYVPAGTPAMVNLPSAPVVADIAAPSRTTTAAGSGAPPSSATTTPWIEAVSSNAKAEPGVHGPAAAAALQARAAAAAW